jgi:hypothetical protein
VLPIQRLSKLDESLCVPPIERNPVAEVSDVGHNVGHLADTGQSGRPKSPSQVARFTITFLKARQ